MISSKFIGSILILIGTSIGAGILALPLVGAPIGNAYSILTLIVTWMLMTVTGLMILEVSLSLDNHACNFSSMAEKTLGYPGKTVAWISCLLLLYALTSAYIAGATSLLKEYFQAEFKIDVPNFLNALLFTLVLGGAVFWSTKATDFLNRGLISIKGVLLFIAVAFLIPHANVKSNTAVQIASTNLHLFASLPVFLCAFGYHTIIPSIRTYLGDKPKSLSRIIILGSTISLVIYIAWISIVLNIVPLTGKENSFEQIFHNKQSVEGLVKAIINITNDKRVIMGINGFTNIAMTTSFLGVTLGLFDFIADAFNRPNTRFGRLQTAILTFTPPFIFALYFPNGFILALSYAAIFIIILEVILPALMVYKLRRNKNLKKNSYRVFGKNWLIFITISIGFILIFTQITGLDIFLST